MLSINWEKLIKLNRYTWQTLQSIIEITKCLKHTYNKIILNCEMLKSCLWKYKKEHRYAVSCIVFVITLEVLAWAFI